MIILGIDPGLANLGWGLIAAGEQSARLLDYGVVTTASSGRLEERISYLAGCCAKLICDNRVEALSIEDIYFVKNKVSALSIAKVIGAIYYAAGMENVPVTTYTPLQIKTTITGMGRADKHQMQEMVRILLGMEMNPQPDHAADALSAAVCHFTHLLGNQRLGLS